MDLYKSFFISQCIINFDIHYDSDLLTSVIEHQFIDLFLHFPLTALSSNHSHFVKGFLVVNILFILSTAATLLTLYLQNRFEMAWHKIHIQFLKPEQVTNECQYSHSKEITSREVPNIHRVLETFTSFHGSIIMCHFIMAIYGAKLQKSLGSGNKSCHYCCS